MRPLLSCGKLPRMPSQRLLFIVIFSLVGSIVLGAAQSRNQAVLSQLKTRAERTDFRETSRYDDILTFLHAVAQNSELVHLTDMGYTSEGRALPLAVVGRVSDFRPETVKASGKLRIYIQANVHAGEVEGKESTQTLIRDIALGRYNRWLDSIVLLIGPD